MRILVTGGSGLIGKHCIAGLRKSGHEVIGTVASSEPPRDGGFWTQTNLLSADDRSKLIAETSPEVLIHLAWDVSDWDGPEQREWLTASEDLIRRFQAQGGSRLFTAGTSMEYAWDGQVCDEQTGRFESSTEYGRAKHMLWQRASSFSEQTGMQHCHGRIFFLCGPGQGATRLVPAIIHALVRGERFLCKSGHLFRDYLDVREVAKSINTLVEGNHRGDYNIASGVPTRVADIVNTIANELGGVERVDFAPAPDEPPADLTVVASVQKLSGALGYTPLFDLNKTVLDTIAWIKERSNT